MKNVFTAARRAATTVVGCVLLLAGPGRAQTFTQVVRLAPGTPASTSEGRAVATDAAGNQLVTGRFAGTLVLGSHTLVSAGGNDGFVAKLNTATGTYAWAVRVGASGDDAALGVAVDAGGNALVTGYFAGTVGFATSPAATSLTAFGGFDVFVAKFDAATGACTWAVRAGGGSDDVGSALAVDAGGNALVTGNFQGTASFASSPAPTALVAAGLTDGFVARFSGSTGACAWAVQVGGSSVDVGSAIAADASGNALVTGAFSGTVSFATSPVPTTVVSAGLTDVFVAKFAASTGTCAWVVPAGGSSYDYGNALAVDAGGNALVTGYFTNRATFANSPPVLSLTAAGAADVFVAKFGAATGACTWAVAAGGTTADVGYGLALDAGGNALVTGSFTGAASFAPAAGAVALASAGSTDVFVAKFGNSTGACAWARPAGGSGPDAGYALALDATGNALVTGAFQNTAHFGSATLTGAGASTGFVTVLVGANSLAAVAPVVLSALTLAPNPTTGGRHAGGPGSWHRRAGAGCPGPGRCHRHRRRGGRGYGGSGAIARRVRGARRRGDAAAGGGVGAGLTGVVPRIPRSGSWYHYSLNETVRRVVVPRTASRNSWHHPFNSLPKHKQQHQH